MRKSISIEKLIGATGGRFSSELGIDLSGADSVEIFKWFLASKLFAARISSHIAMNTYRGFEARNLTTARAILEIGWDGLVSVLDSGGYARYDFSTATKLLAIMNDLEKDYSGDLNQLHDRSIDEEDLEMRLKGLGKGIGDVTVNIFLRELRNVWKKADPLPSEFVRLAAKNLGLLRPRENALKTLKELWDREKVGGRDFCDFEAALLRLGKDYCKRSKCGTCPVEAVCVRVRD
ncbi:MAG: hypothetical protein IMF07_05825 [Proteobacteria bacterium]|nr:hypothetical protein [Pseudomonadota bacterium]